MLKVQPVLFLLDVANLGDVDCNCGDAMQLETEA